MADVPVINILVGCGGSGSKTLQRVNKLLSEDPRMRSRIDNDFYYIIVDTEAAEVEEFEAAIRQQMRGAGMPVIKAITLSQGIPILQRVVDRHFVDPFEGRDDGEAVKGRERLEEHWWVKDGEPFRAPDVSPLAKGAGQCPAASYFLAWNFLESMSNQFEDLVHQIEKRTQLNKVTLEGSIINFCIVAGLSGGTGRGCWELIAFKLRQLFEQQNCSLRPIAYLFDSSCYRNVFRSRPDQELSMRVNALTGISELSCWMRNIHRPDSSGGAVIPYRLPSLAAPADEDMDVLKTNMKVDVKAAAPVHMAYLVCGSSDIATLDQNRDYHKMVGTAIYAALTKSAIDSAGINSHFAYLGLASASFEVDAETLRKYFECRLRCNAVDTLRSDAKDDVESHVHEFFRQTGLYLDVNARDRSKLRPDGKGTFLQRLGVHLLEACETELGSLDEELQAQRVKEVLGAMEDLMNGNDGAVDVAFKAAEESMTADPRQVAGHLVEELYKKTRSVKAVRDFINMLCGTLQKVIDDLPVPSKLRLDESQDPQKLVHKYKGKEYLGVAGPSFNEQESEELRNAVKPALVYANYAAITKKLDDYYKSLCHTLLAYRANGDFVESQLEAVRTKFERQLQELCGAQNDPYDSLFTKGERPEQAIAHQFASSNFYRRVLKPVMSPEREKEILGEVQFGDELNRLILSTLKSRDIDVEDQDTKVKLRRGLETHVRSGVALEPDFMTRNFSIRSVITDLRKCWQTRLREIRGDRDVWDNMCEQFTTFFGVEPQRDGDDVVLPDNEEFVMRMGISLANNCHPYWLLRPKSKVQEQRVTIFLPLTEGSGSLDEASAAEKAEADLPGQKVDVKFGKRDSNEFILLAYATAGVDAVKDIRSFDYWKDDANVMRWLRRCEDPDGMSMFDSSENNKGRGYPEPMVVRDERLTSLRWRPWHKPAEVGAGQDDIDRSVDALMYALLEPTGAIKESLDAMGWSLPLIKDTGSQRFAFTRPPYRYEDQAVTQDRLHWAAEQPIGQSICRVHDGFLGKTEKDGELKKMGVSWRNRILEESEVFWGPVATKCGFNRGSDAYKRLLTAQEDILGNLKDAADGDDRPVFEMLVKRVTELRSA